MSKLAIAAAAVMLTISLRAAGIRAASVHETAGVVIKGYDPAAYFIDNRPVKGSTACTYVHDGVTYRFAPDAHRKVFAADPAKYSPQFGGFCADGTAMSHKADIEPAAVTVIDGKLYLNYSIRVRAIRQKDEAGYIHKVEDAWPTVSQQAEIAC